MFKRHAAPAQAESDHLHQREGLQVPVYPHGEVPASERGNRAGSVAEGADRGN